MIYNKLLKFQQQNIAVKKDGNNPHFKSSYATLNEVLDKVKGPLNEMGILILQTPEHDGLRTTLIDTEDDTTVSCFMPYVETTTAQKLGSCNTYNRRYSLVTLLGLEDTDDDAEEASKPKPKKVLAKVHYPTPEEEGIDVSNPPFGETTVQLPTDDLGF